MPGDFTTTSKSPIAAAIEARPLISGASASQALFASSSTVIDMPGSRSRRNRSAARPSRANPQIATRRPRSSSTRIEHRQVSRGNQMRPALREQSGKVAMQKRRQSPHHRVAAPIHHLSEMCHHCGALLDLSHTLERLVPLQSAQFGKSVDLLRIIQHVAPEYRDQTLTIHERRKNQEHEAAFRTVAAPVARPEL